jgi:hypothetical protein
MYLPEIIEFTWISPFLIQNQVTIVVCAPVPVLFAFFHGEIAAQVLISRIWRPDG